MGANQSADNGEGHGAGGPTSVHANYYELLEIDQSATEEEIKKAYRRKALELHPDRNYGNVEETTRLFAEVQSAYEVLSDPQERAWYDSHRDAVLHGHADATGQQHHEGSMGGTSAADIFKLIARVNGRLDYSDAAGGFFAVLRDAFSTLAQEERAACEWEGLDGLDYPSFGHANDEYEGVVRSFYAVWMGFSTRKSFSWRDAYRAPDAPSRRLRRMVDKENKRLRDDGIREYNDAVRSLVAFVRKRDPRYIPNTQSEEERQQVLRNAAAAQAARSRAAYQAKLDQQAQPEWVKPQETDESEDADEEPEIDEQFECVACSKTFKSEKQFETHEKSKKHIKAVRQLQRKMRADDKAMDLAASTMDAVEAASATLDPLSGNNDNVIDDSKASNTSLSVAEPVVASAQPGNDAEDVDDSNPMSRVHSSKEKDASTEGPEDVASSGPDELQDDDYASRDEVESRLMDERPISTFAKRANGYDLTESVGSLSEDTTALSLQEGQDPSSSGHKLGKAKQKRAKKAAQQSGSQTNNEFICATCHEKFPSKTKLFDHIRDLDHARPVVKSTRGGGKGKRG